MVIQSRPDAIVLWVYDSGKVPDGLAQPIRTATSREIAVFGIRQTLFVTNDQDLAQGSEVLDVSYELQPEILRAGLVPLQGYPPDLVALADKIVQLQNSVPNFPVRNAVTRLSQEFMWPYIFLGLHDIFSQHSSYVDRVHEARQRFSSHGFNKRIDDVLSGAN